MSSHAAFFITELLDFSPKWTLGKATEKGYLRLAQRLMTQSPSKDEVQRAIRTATRFDQLQVVQWFHTTLPPAEAPTGPMDFAANKGKLGILQWLHYHTNATCSVDAMDVAAIDGYLDVTQFLHEHRTEGCTTDAMDNTAIVRFLHEQRAERCTQRHHSIRQ